MIKLFSSSIAVLSILASFPAFATTMEKCQSLRSVQERQDCYVKRALSELPTDRTLDTPAKRVESTLKDPVDKLTDENDKVNAELKGIVTGAD